MFIKFTLALLFKRNKQWLMPCFVVIFSLFLLFGQFAAFLSVRGEADAFCRSIKDIDLWVKSDQLSQDDLIKVRRLPEVALASFLYKGVAKSSMLLGVDESTYLGLPNKSLYGQIRSKNVKSGSIVYATLGRAKELCDNGEMLMAIQASPKTNITALRLKIERITGLKPITHSEFSKRTLENYMKENKAASHFYYIVVSGLILAFAICCAIFYYYFKHEIPNYAVLKATGATPLFMAALLAVEGALISIIGWTVSSFVYFILDKTLAFAPPLPAEILAISLVSLLFISMITGTILSFNIKEAA